MWYTIKLILGIFLGRCALIKALKIFIYTGIIYFIFSALCFLKTLSPILFCSRRWRLSSGVPRRFRNQQGKNAANTPHSIGSRTKLFSLLLRDFELSRQGLPTRETGDEQTNNNFVDVSTTQRNICVKYRCCIGFMTGLWWWWSSLYLYC